MKHIRSLEFKTGSKEELLPDFTPEFPYIATCAEPDRYPDPFVPWHWHKSIEIFYIKSGTLEYTTPKGTWIFPTGSGGMVNSNVLHSSRPLESGVPTVQLLHLFDPSFLCGTSGSRMEAKYIHPITSSEELEILPLLQDQHEHQQLLNMINEAFAISEDDWGYEFKIREALCSIWLKMFELANNHIKESKGKKNATDTVKNLLVFIHEHHAEAITVADLANAAHISKRACFRLFQDYLHTTPIEYIRNYRIQKACQLLTDTDMDVTEIAFRCGFNSSSYFGKLFRTEYGASPLEYRRHWRDFNINRH